MSIPKIRHPGYAFKLLDHSENNCYPERCIHMVRVSACKRGDSVQSQRLHSSREVQRICAVVFSRFYGSHRNRGVEVEGELRGGFARSQLSLQRRTHLIYMKRCATLRKRVSLVRKWGRNAPTSTSATPFEVLFNQTK